MSDKFSEDYVKKLREEAASWRTKCRNLEGTQLSQQIEVELAKRGIEADPSWVTVDEGQELGEAIDVLVTQYPSLQKKDEVLEESILDLEPETRPRVTPRPVAPSTPKSTVPKPVRSTVISRRNISEIRKDPKARAKVRDLYRGLLAKGSNQGE